MGKRTNRESDGRHIGSTHPSSSVCSGQTSAALSASHGGTWCASPVSHRTSARGGAARAYRGCSGRTAAPPGIVVAAAPASRANM